MKIPENLLELKSFTYKFIDPPDIQSSFVSLLSSTENFFDLLKQSNSLLLKSHDYPSLICLLNIIDIKLQSNLLIEELNILLDATSILMRRTFIQTVYNSVDNLLAKLRRNDDIIVAIKIFEIINNYMTDEGRSLIEENLRNLRFLEEMFFFAMFLSGLESEKIEDFFLISYEKLNQKKILNQEKNETIMPATEKNYEGNSFDNTEIFFDDKISHIPKNSPLFDYFLIKMKILKFQSHKDFEILKLEAFKAKFLLFRFLKKENSLVLANEMTENSEFFSFSIKEHVKLMYSKIINDSHCWNQDVIFKTMKVIRFFTSYVQNQSEDFKEISTLFEKILEKTNEKKTINESFFNFLNEFLAILKEKIYFCLTSSYQNNSFPSDLTYKFSVLANYFFSLMKNFNQFHAKIQLKMIEILEIMLNSSANLEEINIDLIFIDKAIYYLKTFDQVNNCPFIESSLINILKAFSNHFKDKQKSSLNQIKIKLKESEFFQLFGKNLIESQKNCYFNKITINFIRFFLIYLDFDPTSLTDPQETELIETFFNVNFCFLGDDPILELYMGLETLKLMKFLIKFDPELKLAPKRLELIRKTITYFLRDDLISPIYREFIHPKYDLLIKDFGKAFSREIIEILELSNNTIEKESFIAIIEKNVDIILLFQNELPERLLEVNEEFKEPIIEQFLKLILNFLMLLSRFFETKWSFREKLFEIIYKKMICFLKFPYILNFDPVYRELLLKYYEPMVLLSKEFIYDLSHYLFDLMELMKEQLNEIKIQKPKNLKSKVFFLNSICHFIKTGFNESLVLLDGLEELSNEILNLYKNLTINDEDCEKEELLDFFIMVLKANRSAYGQNIKKREKNLRFYVKNMIEILVLAKEKQNEPKFLKILNHFIKKIKGIFQKTFIPFDFVLIFDELKGFENIFEFAILAIKNVGTTGNNEVLDLIFFPINELVLLPISLDKQNDLKPILKLYPSFFERLCGIFFSFCSNDCPSQINIFLGKLLYKIIQSMKNFNFKFLERKNAELEEMVEANKNHLKLMGFTENQISQAFLDVNTPKLENLLRVIKPETNTFSAGGIKETINDLCHFDKFLKKEINKAGIKILLAGIKNWKIFSSLQEKNFEEVLLTILQLENNEKKFIFNEIRNVLDENIKIYISENEYLLFHVKIITKFIYLSKIYRCECLYDDIFGNFFSCITNMLSKIKTNETTSFETLFEILNLTLFYLNYKKNSNHIQLITTTLEFLHQCHIPINVTMVQNLLNLILISILASSENMCFFIEHDGLQLLINLEISRKSKDISIDGISLEIFSEIMKIMICDISFLSQSFNQDLMTYFEYQECVPLAKFCKDFGKYKNNTYFIKSVKTVCFVHKNRTNRYFISFNKKNLDQDYKISDNINYILSFIIGNIIDSLADKIEVIQKERTFSFIFLIRILHILIKSYPIIIPFIVNFNIKEFLRKNLVFSKLKGVNTFLEFFCKEMIFVSHKNFNVFLIDIIRNGSTPIKRSKMIQRVLCNLQESLSKENPIDYFNNNQIHRLSCLFILHLDLIKLKNLHFHQIFLDFYVRMIEEIPISLSQRGLIKSMRSTLLEIISYLNMRPLVFFREKGKDFKKEYEERFSKNAQKTINNFTESLNRNGVFEIDLEINEDIKDFSQEFISLEMPQPSSFLPNPTNKIFQKHNYPIYKDLSQKTVKCFNNLNTIQNESIFSDFSFSKFQIDSSSEEINQYEDFSHFHFYQYLMSNKAFYIDEKNSYPFNNDFFQVKLCSEPPIFCGKGFKKKKTPSDDEIVTFLTPNQAFQQRLLEKDQRDDSLSPKSRNENIPEKYALEMMRDCGILYEGIVKKEPEEIFSDCDDNEGFGSQDFLLCNNESCMHPNGGENSDENQNKSDAFEIRLLDVLLKNDSIENKNKIFVDISEKTEKKKKFLSAKLSENKKNSEVSAQILRMILNFLIEEDSYFKYLPIDFVSSFLFSNKNLFGDFLFTITCLLKENSMGIEKILNEIYNSSKEKQRILEIYLKKKYGIKEKTIFLLTLLLEEQNYSSRSSILNLQETLMIFEILPLVVSSKDLKNEDISLSLIYCIMKQISEKDELKNINLETPVIEFLVKKMQQKNEKSSAILSLICKNSPKNFDLVFLKIEQFLNKSIAKISVFFSSIIESTSIIQFSILESLHHNALKISTAIEFINQESKIQSIFKNYSDFWRKVGDLFHFMEASHLFLNSDIQALLPLFETVVLSYIKIYSEKTGCENEESKEEFFLDEFETNEKNNQDIFFYILSKNKKLLNFILRKEKNLFDSKTLETFLKYSPCLVDFELKRQYFNEKLKKYKSLNVSSSASSRIKIRRNFLFLDSFNTFQLLNNQDLQKKFVISFDQEEGLDGGGITKEWYLLLSKEIFNSDYGLFVTGPKGVAYQPNPNSSINSEHLNYFKFAGRVIAKALFDGFLTNSYFTNSFYKQILNHPLKLSDMRDFDSEYYHNLKWILKNEINGNLNQQFSYLRKFCDSYEIVDLIPDGRNIEVTDQNKKEYVLAICMLLLKHGISKQIENFLSGFYELIPKQMISFFDCHELELMMSGLADINISDLQQNTEYHDYSPNSIQIKWFWEILETLNLSEKAAFLQFVTGSSKVPLEGFKALKGIGGIKRFSIHKILDKQNLPTSHTCVNQLELPEYSNKETMRKKLLLAIKEGKEGFGFI